MVKAIIKQRKRDSVVEPNDNKVFVGRHNSLRDYCIELGLINENTPVFPKAKIKDVSGKHVIGVLPLDMACYALSFTTVKLNISRSFDVNELSLEDLREVAMTPKTYEIRRIR